ncbi:glycosyltransferase [Paraburkholderia phenazinium]|jgi:glycosyltransferase involved in cell wall biosynthesis|uniref:Glycosyltransferase involved in cell wall bisynthesis n=1 Tax=Paraburkholderia phenazinium TaxID=60549 RepID=A0A1G8ICK4_9BURK|nr:glycosyltransferase [Paraburkholderia phenazinium]SDI16709.1 Glycosyltransferase involved in cell wall bisynthesis [Paraburkholderia phenazinium]
MRVLFVVGNLGDYHVPRYQALLRLANGRGHEVFLVEVFGKSGVYGFPQDRRTAFFNTHPANCVTLIKDAGEGDGHTVRVAVELFSVFRRFAPDVVVTLGYNTNYSIVLCVLKALTRRCSLIYMSDSKADDGKRYALKERAKRMLVSRFDAALVAGEKHRIYAQSLGVPLERSRVGFDVIDVDYFSRKAREAVSNAADIRARFTLPPRYVLCVSRFVARKNIDLLIGAFFQSGLHAAGVSLVLVGQGPCKEQLLEQIDRLGLNRHVVILSSVPNQHMPGLYALADFVVLASRFDQWGLCINEAFAAGTPAIVTHACGVANELVQDGVNGFIVEPGDESALATKIMQLGGNSTLRERFSANALTSVRRWTPALFASNTIELAEAMIGSAGRTQEVA